MVIAIGTSTKYGEVAAIGWAGERYYWMVDKGGVTTMIPSSLMEDVVDDNGQLELPLDGTLEGC